MNKLELNDKYSDMILLETSDEGLFIMTDDNNDGVILTKEQTKELIKFLVDNLDNIN